jgi:hypothetical protein
VSGLEGFLFYYVITSRGYMVYGIQTKFLMTKDNVIETQDTCSELSNNTIIIY